MKTDPKAPKVSLALLAIMGALYLSPLAIEGASSPCDALTARLTRLGATATLPATDHAGSQRMRSTVQEIVDNQIVFGKSWFSAQASCDAYYAVSIVNPPDLSPDRKYPGPRS